MQARAMTTRTTTRTTRTARCAPSSLNGSRAAVHWHRRGTTMVAVRKPNSARRATRTQVGTTRGLVSIDLGPAAVLGTSLMVSAIALYQVRASRPEVSRDKDVFFSSIGLLCGGILVFQGWRLDPLMLFGELLTAATAVAFATETISLRQELLNVDDEDMRRPSRRRKKTRGRARSLPPVTDSRLEYGTTRRASSWEQGDDSSAYASSRGSFRTAARDVEYDAYGSYADIDVDLNDDVDLENDDYDDQSAFRDGFRTSLGDANGADDAPSRPPTSSKKWENDDWDFV